MLRAAIFIAVVTWLTLGLLRLERRRPHLLRRCCFTLLILGVLSFAGYVLFFELLQHTGITLSATLLGVLDYGLPFLGLVFFALALLAGVALFCDFCLRQLHERPKA